MEQQGRLKVTHSGYMQSETMVIRPDELIKEILRLPWPDIDHEVVKSKLSTFLSEAGFAVTPEYPIPKPGNQRIDLYAKDIKTNFTLGIEIDRATPKFKSVAKLRTLNPSLALMILRSSSISKDKIWQKIREFPSEFAVLNLAKSCLVFSKLELAHHEKSATLVQKIVALGEDRNPNGLSELFSYLSHQDGNVRRLTCSALGKIGSPIAERPLVGMLFDSKPQVRQYAINALGKVGTAYSLPVLRMISNSRKDKEYNVEAAKEATLRISRRATRV